MVEYQDMEEFKNCYLKDGKIAVYDKERDEREIEAKNKKLGYSKMLKDLNKGSLIAKRFLDTVNIANKNISKKNDKKIEILPLLREAQLKQKKRQPVGANLTRSITYVAPLDRKTYTMREKLRNDNENCNEIVQEALQTQRKNFGVSLNKHASAALLPTRRHVEKSRLDMPPLSKNQSAKKHSPTSLRDDLTSEATLLESSQQQDKELLKHAEQKRYTLLARLLQLERKRVKTVKDNIEKTEIVGKIQRTETVIKRYKQLERRLQSSQPINEFMEEAQDNYGKTKISTNENLDFLKQVIEPSFTGKSKRTQALIKL